MSKSFYPAANRTIQYWGGVFFGSTMNTNCVCLHTTEGFTWPSYSGGAVAPHLTVLPNIAAKTVSVRQHYPADKSSRALANLAGGVETNTLNVLQIELIGTCDYSKRSTWLGKTAGVDYIYWPDAPDWLLEAIAPIFTWMDAEWPNFKIADATPRGWVKYPDSYGINARQRMSFSEWENAYGIFGHQHVPENAHGDPGNFPIARLIAFAKPDDSAGGGTAPIPDPAPTPDPTPTPEPVGPEVETISANLAGYDKVYGMRTRVSRARTSIPTYFAAKRPTWLHFQECAIDMWPELDKKLTEYTRVPAGGKGRESYYRKDAGIRIIEAKLLNVEHMLLKDTKEHLVIAWEKDGYEAVDVNFHNENEGSTYQSVQLRDVMNHARDMADKHGIPRANILVTGDSNTKAAAYLARLWGWTEAIYKAAKKIDLEYHSTNGWRAWNAGGLTLGRRIDVDITQRSAEVLEAEQLFGALTGDHWAHRVLRRLVK